MLDVDRMSGPGEGASGRMAFVVDTGESIHDPGVGRFYGGLIGGLENAGFDVTPVGLTSQGSDQLAALSGRLAEGAPPKASRWGPLRQTVGDTRDVLRWNARRPARGPFDHVVELHHNGRFEGWRIARRDSATHILFIDEIGPIDPPRRSLLGPALRMLERKRYHGADAVVFRTGALARAYLERWGEPKRWATSHMAVDPHAFSPSAERRTQVRAALGIDATELVIGVVAFFAPYHRADLVGPLIEQLRADGIPARGVLVGGWANAAAALHEQLVRDRPAEWAHVTVTGAVAQDDVAGFIDAFDVGLMPGSNWYGSPTKIIEYGAMGKPVVGARTAAIEEVIRDGAEGLLADGVELTRAVFSTLRDMDAAQVRARAFRARVLQEHTWDARGRALADLLN
jgi:glycosyltransferase involved in cell wall biosynthesis